MTGKVVRETGKGLFRVDETKTAAGRRTTYIREAKGEIA